MPTALDHLLFIVLVTLFPVWAVTFGFRRLKRATPQALPGVRRSVYRAAMVSQWVLSAATLGLWWARGRSWRHLGVVPGPTPGLAGIAVGLGVVAWFEVRQRRQMLVDAEALAEVRRRMGRLELMLPHSPEELSAFFRLSVTAGLCEELLYRGYLIWYLTHWLGLLQAAGIASIVFGLGHAYQGWKGMLLTSIVGAFLAALYLVSGSLIAPMIVHALMDMRSGYLAYAALSGAGAMPDEALGGAAGVEDEPGSVPEAGAGDAGEGDPRDGPPGEGEVHGAGV